MTLYFAYFNRLFSRHVKHLFRHFQLVFTKYRGIFSNDFVFESEKVTKTFRSDVGLRLLADVKSKIRRRKLQRSNCRLKLRTLLIFLPSRVTKANVPSRGKIMETTTEICETTIPQVHRKTVAIARLLHKLFLNYK